MRRFDTSGADPHKVRPVVKAARQAHLEALAKANERERKLNPPESMPKGLRLVKG